MQRPGAFIDNRRNQWPYAVRIASGTGEVRPSNSGEGQIIGCHSRVLRRSAREAVLGEFPEAAIYSVSILGVLSTARRSATDTKRVEALRSGRQALGGADVLARAKLHSGVAFYGL